MLFFQTIQSAMDFHSFNAVNCEYTCANHLTVSLLISQALLRGAVSQQSAVILVCMAIDRYLYLLHPNTYHKHSSKKVCENDLGSVRKFLFILISFQNSSTNQTRLFSRQFTSKVLNIFKCLISRAFFCSVCA